jgi:protein O-GlcNAc transferase
VKPHSGQLGDPAAAAINQALAQANAGRLDAAIAALRLAVQRFRTSSLAHQTLASLLLSKGEIEQGLYMMRRGMELAPGSAAAHNNLGYALMQAGRSAEALEALRESVRLDPSYGMAWGSMCTALTQCRHYKQAAKAGERATQLRPDLADAWLNRGIATLETGDAAAAVRCLQEAHGRFPEHQRLHSTLLMAMQSLDLPAEQIFAAHAEFGRPRPVSGAAAVTEPDPERPLRLGFVSGDLGAHSVSYFLEPLLARLNREEFGLYCFATSKANDQTTARLRSLAGEWIDARNLNDAALDASIRAAQVDILFELGGHTGTNRLLALVNKPAPVIISAIGYPDTTGLPAVDYRLVDSTTDPAGAESRATEHLLRLDPCFLCYRPAADVPEIAEPAPGGGITFGSFNALPKHSAATIRAWSRILDEVEGSRLLIKSTALEDPEVRSDCLERWKEMGLDPARVELRGQTASVREHLDLYGRIDIALDPFPYNGTTTTCEALWMGVPVITAMGSRHAARVGASLLHAAGLGEMVAADVDGYVALARSLARDAGHRRELRMGMRQRLLASPLLDQAAYAHRLGAALRAVWRRYCSDQLGESG